MHFLIFEFYQIFFLISQPLFLKRPYPKPYLNLLSNTSTFFLTPQSNFPFFIFIHLFIYLSIYLFIFYNYYSPHHLHLFPAFVLQDPLFTTSFPFLIGPLADGFGFYIILPIILRLLFLSFPTPFVRRSPANTPAPTHPVTDGTTGKKNRHVVSPDFNSPLRS